MMLIENSEARYGIAIVALHWIMAFLLIVLITLGIYMVRLPDEGFDTLKIQLILYHKEAGMFALALAVLRLAWRVGDVLPRLVETLPDWQKLAARFVHLSFYALMLALPMTGWLMSSAGGFPISFLGLFDLPDLVRRSDYLFQVFVEVHQWLGYGLVALLVVHAGAALRHHFILKDDTLRKMLLGSAAVSPFAAERTRQAPSGPLR